MNRITATLNLRHNLVQSPHPAGQSQRYARHKAKVNKPSDIKRGKVSGILDRKELLRNMR